jgi:hypothetical protein
VIADEEEEAVGAGYGFTEGRKPEGAEAQIVGGEVDFRAGAAVLNGALELLGQRLVRSVITQKDSRGPQSPADEIH